MAAAYCAAAGGGVGRRRLRRSAEVHLGRCCDLGLVRHGEVRLHLEVEHLRGEVGREAAHGGVERPHRRDVAVARHGDAVFRALELRLQVAEIGIRLEIGISLGDGEQALQRLGQLALRGLELRESLRIGEQLGRHLDGAHLGARLGDADEHGLLLRRVALHGIDEVRDEIGAALVLVDHLGPGRLHALVLLLERVVAAAAEGQGGYRDECESRSAHGHPLNSLSEARL